MMRYLKVELPEWDKEITVEKSREDPLHEILFSMDCCKSQFGRDLMDGVDLNNPNFYSEFSWKKFTGSSYFDVTGKFWDDNDDLDLFQE
jgi:hypothetical protein